MAPSANRRSGSSRRAQYSTFFGYIGAALGALVGIALLVVSILDPSAFAGLRGTAQDATAPAGRAAAGTRAIGQGVFGTLGGYVMAGSQNAKLSRELAEAKVRLVEAQATADENRRLKALLGLFAGEQRPVAITRLMASTASGTRRFATIAAGADHGIQVGMPVRTPLGVIGRVLEVSRVSSRVLLLTDTESVVPVRRSTDGVAAFAQGRGDGTVQLRLISLGLNPIKLGDVFVTSGSGGLYRPGMATVRVTQLTRDGAITRLLSDPGSSDYVSVEPIWLPEVIVPAASTPAAGAR
jgi:rod shape-determining protein MreC